MAMESLIPDSDAYGVVRRRTAGNLPGVVPSGMYPTADGQSVMIAGNSSNAFGRLMALVGRSDLGEDPTLADGDARTGREAELDAAISDWTSRHTAVDAVDLLSAAGVPAGPVYDAVAIAADPHYREREMLRPLKVAVEEEAEEIRFPGVVPKVPGPPATSAGPARTSARTPTRF